MNVTQNNWSDGLKKRIQKQMEELEIQNHIGGVGEERAIAKEVVEKAFSRD